MSLRGRLLAAIFSAGARRRLSRRPACAETLADAIALAYETNPTLQAQRATQRALDENYVQARTGWRPTARACRRRRPTPRSARPAAARGGLIDTNGDGIPDTIRPRPASARRNSGSVGLSFTQPI